MKVLVTGATGFVGSEVCRHLARTGHTSRLLVRHPNSSTALNLAPQTNSELVRGDVTDSASLLSALNGVDAILHLVGIISEAGSATFEKIHVRGTENLVAAAHVDVFECCTARFANNSNEVENGIDAIQGR